MSMFGQKMIRYFGMAIVAGTVITAATVSKADWTENRNGCSFTCHTYFSTGTCKGPFGIRGPCVTKNKRCSKDYCTSTSH